VTVQSPSVAEPPAESLQVRGARLQRELRERLDRLERLHHRLVGQLFLLQRQRRWQRHLLRQRLVQRGTPGERPAGKRYRRSA
jgi:hypothetical protein